MTGWTSLVVILSEAKNLSSYFGVVQVPRESACEEALRMTTSSVRQCTYRTIVPPDSICVVCFYPRYL